MRIEVGFEAKNLFQSGVLSQLAGPALMLSYDDASNKIAALRDEFGMMMSEGFAEEVRDMSNLAEGVLAEGIEQGVELGIEQGLKQGMVRMCQELGLTCDEATTRVAQALGITYEQAEAIVAKYWT